MGLLELAQGLLYAMSTVLTSVLSILFLRDSVNINCYLGN